MKHVSLIEKLETSLSNQEVEYTSMDRIPLISIDMAILNNVGIYLFMKGISQIISQWIYQNNKKQPTTCQNRSTLIHPLKQCPARREVQPTVQQIQMNPYSGRFIFYFLYSFTP